MNSDNVKLLIQSATKYDVPDTDVALLSYLYNNEVQDILNDCNLETLPDELQYIAEEWTAGRYIQLKKSTMLEADGDGLEVVTRIQEGDTTVELNGDTADSRLDALAAAFLRERDLSCYRKLRW